jgi:hypothetical protein
MKSGKLHSTKVKNVTILPVPQKSKLIMERLKKGAGEEITFLKVASCGKMI